MCVMFNKICGTVLNASLAHPGKLYGCGQCITIVRQLCGVDVGLNPAPCVILNVLKSY